MSPVIWPTLSLFSHLTILKSYPSPLVAQEPDRNHYYIVYTNTETWQFFSEISLENESKLCRIIGPFFFLCIRIRKNWLLFGRVLLPARLLEIGNTVFTFAEILASLIQDIKKKKIKN